MSVSSAQCSNPISMSVSRRTPRTRPRGVGNEEFFWSLVDTTGECWEWQAGRTAANYGMFVHWAEDGSKKNVLAHRYALMLEGQQVEGKVVRHQCDNPPCVRPSHLLTGSMADNMNDRMMRGRAARKLDPERVREIRSKFAEGGWTKAALAREYGVHERAITFIVRREHWKHVD